MNDTPLCEVPRLHGHGCDCDLCAAEFLKYMAFMKHCEVEDLCELCQGTGNYYRQWNEFGFGVCTKCRGNGLKKGFTEEEFDRAILGVKE